MLPQRQPGLRPLLEMLGGVDRAARVAPGSHRPVLRESRGAEDRGGVDAPFAPDFVGAAVAVEGAVARVVAVVAGVVLVAEVFDHVVFDQGLCGPAVQAEVGVAGCAEGAGVVEEPGRDVLDMVDVECWVGRSVSACLSVYLHALAKVAFSYDEVASGWVAPVHRVLAGVAAVPCELCIFVGPVLG